MHRVILHLDMDAFYAAVEQRDQPALKGKPVIVGSPPTRRGVVCAASYEARKFGVRSAMPSVTAGRLCPQGVFIRPRMDAYRDESRRIMEIVARTGEIVEQVSVDEAYLDVSKSCQGADPDESLLRAVPLAKAIKQAILAERRLTTSIGIAANKLLAKLGSDFSKPDGLTLIPERDKVEFLRPLPVRVIHGVGKVTEDQLQRIGVRSIGDLQDHPGNLQDLVGSFGARLKRFALGEDDRPLDLGDHVKSISCEETFLEDTDDRPMLRRCLRTAATEIAGKLNGRHSGARTVQVKVRYSDFTTLTRQITLEDPITEASDLYRLGCYLLGRDRLVVRPLRLLGLGVTGLTTTTRRQLLLL